MLVNRDVLKLHWILRIFPVGIYHSTHIGHHKMGKGGKNVFQWNNGGTKFITAPYFHIYV